MTLLELITKATVSAQTPTTPPDYPVVLDPDSIFPNLNLEDSELCASNLAVPVTGWKISQLDSEVIDLCKHFFTKLQGKLKNPTTFAKEEFLEILKSFLENVNEKLGLSIRVASSNSGYTKVLVEKVGFCMGKDVAALVLEACIVFEIWELVETLISYGLVVNSCYPSLVPKLVASERSDLLCHCIKQASDLGSSELLAILKYFLSFSKKAASDNTMLNVRNEWEKQALFAMEKATDKTLSVENSILAKEAAVLLMVAYDNFSSQELCLHYLLASVNIDDVVLSSAFSKLNGKEMKSLIRYLGKWLKKYERFPQAVPCQKASTLFGLKACDWVPKLEDVARCLGLVLDGNFSALVLHPGFHEELISIESVVCSLALDSRLFCSVANVIEKFEKPKLVQGS
ncbi:hypothetical protein G4B88_008235 [Cannabis sativa]|uniref:Uncharacterized protein n=1 Tax=Cannabis sativa TaxID=3483 RepID=A0A7J6FP21_CANSA|nr:hypothetical protein G4B88_008235 [Cannabis sativa]